MHTWRVPPKAAGPGSFNQAGTSSAGTCALHVHHKCCRHASRAVPACARRPKSSGASGGGARGKRARGADSGNGGDVDAQLLLRELNEGGSGWLVAEEEQDWGLDGLAAHARATAPQQRPVGREGRARGAPGEAPTASSRAGGRRRQRGGAAADGALGDASAVASGLAKVAAAPPHTPAGQPAPAPHAGSAAGGSRVEVQATYARRNPEVVAALQLRGLSVEVIGPRAGRSEDDDGGDGEDGADDDDAVPLSAASRSYLRSGWGGGDGSSSGEEAGRDAGDGDDGFGIDVELDLLEDDDQQQQQQQQQGGRKRRAAGRAGRPAARGAGAGAGAGAGSGQAAPGGGATATAQGPSGSVGWYSELAAAGFELRTSAAGETFLERSIRPRAGPGARKAQAGASAAAEPAAPAEATGPAAYAAAAPPAAAPAPLRDPFEDGKLLLPCLRQLATPQQVLDFLELCFPAWAANGYRLVDQASGQQLRDSPTPAEAAHCLRALALAARRARLGAWRCMDLAQGRACQGLAEALRVTPPRLLPEQQSAELTARFFDAARQYWLDPAAERIQDPAAPPAALAGGGGTAGAGLDAADAAAASAADDAGYQRLLARYEALSDKRRQLQQRQQQQQQAPSGIASAAQAGASQLPPPPQQQQQPTAAAKLNGHGVLPQGPAQVQALRGQQVPGGPCGWAALSGCYAGVAPGGGGPLAVPASGGVSSFQAYVAGSAPLPQLASADELMMMAGDAAGPSGAAGLSLSLGSLDSTSSAGSLSSIDAQQGSAASGASSVTPLAAAAAVAAAATSLAGAGAGIGTGGPLPPRAAQPPLGAPAAGRGAVAAAAGGWAFADPAARRYQAKVDCLLSAVWALASLGGPPYFGAEVDACVNILARSLSGGHARISGRAAGELLWALGYSRHHTPRLAEVEAELMKAGGLSALPPQDLTYVLWGFATLGHRPQRLLFTIRPDWAWAEPQRGPRHRPLKGDVRSFSSKQLAAVAWALSVMQEVDSTPFRSAWARLMSTPQDVPPSEAVLTQIWQASLSIHLESDWVRQQQRMHAQQQQQQALAVPAARSSGAGKPGSRMAAALESGVAFAAYAAAACAASSGSSSAQQQKAAAAAPPVLDRGAVQALLGRAQGVFLARTSALRQKVHSGYQRAMANVLTGMRLMHLLEDNSSGYAVDIALPQLRIAVEADGPTHVARTPPGVMLGATAMKRRHLQLMGWQVINVAFKEWDRLPSDAARRALLQARINDALLSSVQLDEEQAEPGPGPEGGGGGGAATATAAPQ